MPLEMERNGAAKRISGQQANSMLAPQPHSGSSVGSVVPCQGEGLLAYLKSPFFLPLEEQWG